MTTVVKASDYPAVYTRSGDLIGLLKDAYDVLATDEMITDSTGQEVIDLKLPFGSDNRDILKNELILRVSGVDYDIRTVWDGWDEGNQVPVTSVHGEAAWYGLGDCPSISGGVDTDGNPIGYTSAADALEVILTGSGWWYSDLSGTSTGYYTLASQTTPLAAVRALPASFGGEIVFDNINHMVNIVAHRGSTTPVAMYATGRNLVGDARNVDTTDLVTRLYPYGATTSVTQDDVTTQIVVDIHTVNSGVDYIEDYSYYDDNGIDRVTRAQTIVNSAITDPTVLLAWARIQLGVLAKAATSYQVQQSNTGGGDATPQLGDVVRVYDKRINADVLARIETRNRNILQPHLTTYVIDSALLDVVQFLLPPPADTGADTSTVDNTTPLAPETVTVTSSAATSASAPALALTATWDAVTNNVDGSDWEDPDYYEVQWTYDHADWQSQRVAYPDVSTLLGTFPVGGDLTARVRSVSKNGNTSDWTTSAEFTLAAAGSGPPIPSTPSIDATTLPGIARVFWNGNTQSGSDMRTVDPNFDHLEVHVSTSSGFTPNSSTLVDTLMTNGISDVTQAYGVTFYVRFVAVDNSGRTSAPSTQTSSVVRQLVDTDAITGFVTARLMGPNVVAQANIQNLAVGTAQMIDLAVVNAKIGNLAVNDAKISDLSVGKLTVGTLVADVTVSARIKTANTGARVELNSLGFFLYDSSNAQRVSITASASDRITFANSSGTTVASIISGGGFGNLAVESSTGDAYLGINNNNAIIHGFSFATIDSQGTIFLAAPNITADGVLNMQGFAINTAGGNINGGPNITGGGSWTGGPTIHSLTTDGDNINIHGSGGAWSIVIANIPTGGAAANAVINSAGKLVQSTSARRYKQDIKSLEQSQVNKILNLEPITYRAKVEVEEDPDAPSYWGMIAEDVHTAGVTGLVVYKNGKPEAIHYDRLAVGMLTIVRDHRDRLNSVESRLEKAGF